MEQNFQDIYEQLQSRIRQAEDKRLQLKAKGTKNGLIAGGITLVAGVVVSLIIGGGWPGILIACMLGLIVLFSCIQSKSGELCAYYKENIISSIISYLCQEASYRPESGIAESVFMNSRLFSTSPDRYRSEDLICGKIDKTSFICSEIIAEEKRVTTDSKGRRQEHWIDIFRGFFFIADFNKNFQGQIAGRRWCSTGPSAESTEYRYRSDGSSLRYLDSGTCSEYHFIDRRKFRAGIR